jgi:hypothetical protein
VSYDLCFWKEEPGPRKDASNVYTALLDRQQVPGLLPFPIDAYLTAVTTEFPAAARESEVDQLSWVSGDERSMFEITWSPVHVLVTLRGSDRDVGNRLVEIAASLGAPLYDPQTDERFDSWIDG